MSIKSFLLPALLAASLGAAPSFAEDAASKSVTIDRAELLTQEGAARTYAHIQSVATEVCRSENRGGADFARSVHLCVADTMVRTVEALDAPYLSAVHDRSVREIRLASAG